MVKDAFTQSSPRIRPYSIEALERDIKNERPDLEGKLFYTPQYNGISSHTLIVGDEVFKGPKSEMAVELLDSERRILEYLQGRGLPIPDVTCIGRNASFYGMQRLGGIIACQYISFLNENEERLCAKDLAVFFAKMIEAFPRKFDPARIAKEREIIRSTFEMPEVIALMGADLDFCKQRLTDYVDRAEKRGMMMIHGDLHAANITIDRDTKRLAGVFDFGNCEYNYPERDQQLIYMPRFFSANFAKAFRQELAVLIPDMGENDFDCYKLLREVHMLGSISRHSEGKRKLEYSAEMTQTIASLKKQEPTPVKAAGPVFKNKP